MKFLHRCILPALGFLIAHLAYGATSSSYVLLHQMPSLAALEADLQNREIGLDPVDKCAVGKFTDGSKFHVICQEMPSVGLAGNLTVSGNALLNGPLTAAAGAFSGPVTGNAAGSGTSSAFLASSASPTYTWISTGSAANAKNWDAQASGNVLAFRTRTDANAAGADWLDVTRSGTTVSSVAFPSAVTMASTLGVTGDLTVSNGTSTGAVLALTSTDVGGQIWRIGSGGSANGAFPTGSLTFRNSTTGFNWLTISSAGAAQFPGTLGVTSLLTASSGIDVSGGTSAAGRLTTSAANGLVIRGKSGSTYDMVLSGAGGSDLLYNPTGTTTLQFPGLINATAGIDVSGGTGAAGRIYTTASAGTIIWSKGGSLFDFVLTNSAAANVMTVAPGTTTATFPGLITASNGITTTDNNGLITNISASNRTMITRSGTTLNFGENGGWTAANYNVASGSHSFGVGGSTRFQVDASGANTSGTLGVTGVATFTAASVHNGGITLGGRFIDKTTSVTSGTTTLGNSHSSIFADATSGNITLNLPAASGNAGLTYTIYKTDAVANTVTIDGNASETVGGSLTQVLAGNSGFRCMRIICDGTNWQVTSLNDEGTFTVTYASGATTTPTGTASFVRVNKAVTLILPQMTVTSNATNMTWTGVPATYRPTTTQHVRVTAEDNSIFVSTADVAVLNSTNLVFYLNGDSNGWTSSGAKGLAVFCTVAYTLQ